MKDKLFKLLFIAAAIVVAAMLILYFLKITVWVVKAILPLVIAIGLLLFFGYLYLKSKLKGKNNKQIR